MTMLYKSRHIDVWVSDVYARRIWHCAPLRWVVAWGYLRIGLCIR